MNNVMDSQRDSGIWMAISGRSSAAQDATGRRLGFYRSLGESGGLTADELAHATGVLPDLTREWLVLQVAHGMVSYDDLVGRFYLTPQQEQRHSMRSQGAPVSGMAAAHAYLRATTPARRRAGRPVDAPARLGAIRAMLVAAAAWMRGGAAMPANLVPETPASSF